MWMSLLEDSREVGLEVNPEKLSIWLYLTIKMQEKITVYWLLINPLKMWWSSGIWEQQWQIKIGFMEIKNR
jgi:hypothetical protein